MQPVVQCREGWNESCACGPCHRTCRIGEHQVNGWGIALANHLNQLDPDCTRQGANNDCKHNIEDNRARTEGDRTQDEAADCPKDTKHDVGDFDGLGFLGGFHRCHRPGLGHAHGLATVFAVDQTKTVIAGRLADRKDTGRHFGLGQTVDHQFTVVQVDI